MAEGKITRTKGARPGSKGAEEPSGGSAHNSRYPVCQVRFSSQEEKEQAEELARKCGFNKLAGFMKALSLAHDPPSKFDHQVILEISALSGEMGKVGGLLKQRLGEMREAGANPLDVAPLREQLDAIANVRRNISRYLVELDKLLR